MMKKAICFIVLTLLLFSSVAYTQELQLKSFVDKQGEGIETTVKIKWVSPNLNLQVILKDQNKKALDYADMQIIFLDKDDFVVYQYGCYIRDMLISQEGNTEIRTYGASEKVNKDIYQRISKMKIVFEPMRP